MIAIIDYGAGNLCSVGNLLDQIGADYRVFQNPDGLTEAAKIILPGVGHFGQMMRALDQRGFRAPILERINARTPFLGICLGLQALCASSEEAPEERGFGIFPERVRRFSTEARVPHMGWNELDRRSESRLLAGLTDRPYVYFANSYYVPEMDAMAAACNYAAPFTAVLEQGNVFGVQFHPEKSGAVGRKIVENFVF